MLVGSPSGVASKGMRKTCILCITALSWIICPGLAVVTGPVGKTTTEVYLTVSQKIEQKLLLFIAPLFLLWLTRSCVRWVSCQGKPRALASVENGSRSLLSFVSHNICQ